MLRYLNILIATALFFISITVSAQNYFYLGTGTSATNGASSSPGTLPSPFGTYFEDNRTQYLILASELNALGANGELLSVAFDVVNPTQSMNGFNVKVGHTTATSLAAYQQGLTNVYSGSHTPITGWNSFTFSQPFIWDGISNLVVEVCFDNTFWTSNSTVKYTTTTFNSVFGTYADGATGCAMINSNGWGQDFVSRPNMRLQFTPPFSNNAALTELTKPEMPTCVLGDSVAVRLKNYGLLPLTSANIEWELNGVAQTTVAWTGNLTTFSDASVYLSTISGGLQNGDVIKAWSAMPNGVQDSSAVIDTIEVEVNTSLSGTYIVSSNNGDYSSLNDAATALSNYGVCGPVVLALSDSVYSERVDWETYEGMSLTNTVTIQSLSGNRNDVYVGVNGVSALENAVFDFTHASHFRVQNISLANYSHTYSTTIGCLGNSEDVIIQNCVLENLTTTNPSSWGLNRNVVHLDGDSISDWEISGSVVHGGRTGIYVNASFSLGPVQNMVIKNNEIRYMYVSGISGSNMEDVDISGNEFHSPSVYNFGDGIRLNNAVSAVVSDNYIRGNGVWPRNGIYVLNTNGNINDFSICANNRVYLPQASNINRRGISLINCLLMDVAHNSAFVEGSSTSNALYISGSQYVNLQNNSIQVTSSGSALYLGNINNIFTSDYNNFSAPNGNAVSIILNTYTSLSDWQTFSNMDSNSVNIDDYYSDTVRLKMCNPQYAGNGVTQPFVTHDFENDPRPNPPTIGADEYVSVQQQSRVTEVHLCEGDTFKYDYSDFDTVIWNNQTYSPTFNVYGGPQTITVYGSNVCGSFLDTISVTEQDYVDIVPDSFCSANPLVVDAGISPATYLWSTGDTTQTIAINSVQTIWVQVTDTFGCSSSDTASYVVRTPPYVALQSDSFCGDTSLIVDAGVANAQYLWSTGDTSQTVVVDSTQQLWVNVTDSFGCSSSDTASYSIIPLPTASFTFNLNFLTAHFTSSVQNADPSTTYFWDFGDGYTSTDPNPIHVLPWTVLDTIQVVSLTVTNNCGSTTFTDTISIDINSVEEAASNRFKLYPNPTSGDLFIQSVVGIKLMNVAVFDTKGARVLSKEFEDVHTNQTYAVQMHMLPKGMYVVHIVVDDQPTVFKVTKL